MLAVLAEGAVGRVALSHRIRKQTLEEQHLSARNGNRPSFHMYVTTIRIRAVTMEWSIGSEPPWNKVWHAEQFHGASCPVS